MEIKTCESQLQFRKIISRTKKLPNYDINGRGHREKKKAGLLVNNINNYQRNMY